MVLKKIYSKNFPFPGYIALTFAPWIFIREDLKDKYTTDIDRHETTHALQQKETLWLLFLLVYGLEYIIKFPICDFDCHRTYRSISFEQEASVHETQSFYNDIRKPYAWISYVFKLNE